MLAVRRAEILDIDLQVVADAPIAAGPTAQNRDGFSAGPGRRVSRSPASDGDPNPCHGPHDRDRDPDGGPSRGDGPNHAGIARIARQIHSKSKRHWRAVIGRRRSARGPQRYLE
jgi:hypothetical protein